MLDPCRLRRHTHSQQKLLTSQAVARIPAKIHGLNDNRRILRGLGQRSAPDPRLQQPLDHHQAHLSCSTALLVVVSCGQLR
jgi:hypothetical protein